MRKSRFGLLSLVLVLSVAIPPLLMADDLVSLKNLAWEEQTGKTRIILETSKPLVYNVTASGKSSELAVELSNLDLRNLPQELFLNTDQVVSLQTFPQTDGQKAKIIVKMTAFGPHEVTADGNKLYIDIESAPSADRLVTPTLPAPAAAPAAPSVQYEKVEPVNTEAPVQNVTDHPAVPQAKAAEPEMKQVAEAKPPVESKPVVESRPKQAEQPVAPATQVRGIRIDSASQSSADVVVVGDGSFDYSAFELSNPQRLVVDLKSVNVAPSVKSSVTSSSQLFSKVRIGQFQVSPRVTRAVIDLNMKVPYNITKQGKELRIHLGEGSAASASDTSLPAEPANASPDNEESDNSVAMAQATPAPVDEPQNHPAATTATTASTPEPAAQIPAPSVAAAPQIAQTDEPEKMTKDEAKPSTPMKDDQFFAIKPDTSLFAQDEQGGTPPPPPPPATTGGTGMGTFQEKTVKSGEKQYTGEPFSFDFKDIDIADLFRFIADISGLNVILDPSVKGSVTLKLTEVPWDQALDLITKNQGLGYTIEGNVIRIAPLSKIAAEERARFEAARQQMLSAPLVTKIKPLSYAKASEVDRVVKRLLTEKGSSIIDSRTNTIIITDIDTNIDAIINLIDTLDSRTTQVLIEARIVETNKNFEQAFGIQWGFRGLVDPAFGNNTTLQFPNNMLVSGNQLQSTGGITGNPLGGYAVNLPTNSAPSTALLLSAGNILDTFRLDVALTALENSGNGRILSSPKVATQNNTRAEILQGQQIPVQTIANDTVTTTFVNAALRLSVTPQITAEGTIIMEVEVENNRPDFAHTTGLAGTGTPAIFTERASTTLLVEDGGTTVIGGIFKATEAYAQARTPGLHRIPLLGWLFKNTNISRDNAELLIFLTPRILR